MKLESSFNGIAITDEQGNFEYVNDSFLEITGWTRDELIGQFFMKVFPDNIQEFIRERWAELQKGIEIPYGTMIRTKSGEIKYVFISHYQAEIGGKKRFLSVIKDVPEKKEPGEVLEKKELELALKESEDRYRDLFENAIDGMYINDTEGYIRNINKSGLKMLGCSAEDAIGTHVSRWFTPESMRLTMETARKKILGEPVEDPMIRQIVTRSGEVRWAEIRSCIIKKGDSIVGVHGIARDITDRIKLEQKLKESEAKYRELFENANDMILIGDKEGYILDVNSAIIRALGCTMKDEVIGTHFSDWYTPESRKIAQNNQKKYISGEPVKQPQILEFICKNGEHRWVEIRSRIIKQGDEALGIHSIGRDITEKIKLDQALKESEAKYRELFENAQDAMYVVDIEGNILEMNRVGLRILGCTREEVIGKNISEWLTPESLRIAEERRKKHLSGEVVTETATLEIVNKDGESRWVEIKTRNIKEGDGTLEIHGIARDVTENMRLKQELKKSNKQRKLLCHLIERTRGGKTRALILKRLVDRSYNAHQLAKALNMDYKTIRHHLNVLIKNKIITMSSDGYTSIYFLSENSEDILHLFSKEAMKDS